MPLGVVLACELACEWGGVTACGWGGAFLACAKRKGKIMSSVTS